MGDRRNHIRSHFVSKTICSQYVSSMEKTIHSARYKVFIERIRALRKKAGLTQREFAGALDVPRSTVARIEMGERRVDVVEYLQILEVLGVEPKAEFRKLVDAASKAG